MNPSCGTGETNHWIADVVAHVLTGSRKATKYVSESLVIKCSGQRKIRRGERRTTVVLTYGKPNYMERLFIKACKKAGEPFPVKRVQLREWK